MEKDNPIYFLNSLSIRSKITFEDIKKFLVHMDGDKLVEPKIKLTDEYTLNSIQKKVFKIEKTTVGRFLFNAFCIPQEYIDQFGFINTTMDKGMYGKMHENLSILLTDEVLSKEIYADTIDRITWLGMNMNSYKGKCMDFNSIHMSKQFLDKKNKVYKELKDKKASGNEILAAEDELIADALKEKKGTGLVEIIKSGAKGSFTNNYKVLNIGRGITKNGSGELVLLDRSLAEGNKPSDYVNLSNNGIQGTYGRSMKTAQGGYLTKLVTTGFSYLGLSKTTQDCHTDSFLEVTITSSNFKEFLYRNVRIPGRDGWIELNLKNYKDFLGKKVYLRSPMFCRCTDGICLTCYGNLYKKNRITTGLNVLLADLTSKIMNTSMKSMASAYSDICIKQCELPGKLSA